MNNNNILAMVDQSVIIGENFDEIWFCCLVKQQTFCTVAGGMKCKREKPNMRNEWWFGIFFFLLDFLGLYNIILYFNERIITIFPILIWSNKCFPCSVFLRYEEIFKSTKFHINLRKCPMRKVNIYMLKQSVDIGCAYEPCLSRINSLNCW